MTQQAPDFRTKLTQTTSADDFLAFYWLKSELQEFCREHGISTAGGKREIADRIECFLRTGVRTFPVRGKKDRMDTSIQQNAATNSPLSMTTQAPRGFRCNQENRRFFEQHLGKKFRFSVPLQNFIKAHPGVTFAQIAAEWERLESLRRNGQWQTEIAPQFEFNQFTRDFHADPRNIGRTRADCLEAWNRTRARRGNNKYCPEEHPNEEMVLPPESNNEE
jgi:hypothetical protein